MKRVENHELVQIPMKVKTTGNYSWWTDYLVIVLVGGNRVSREISRVACSSSVLDTTAIKKRN